MKPETAATTAVSALLAAAILCFGTRQFIDSRRQESAASASAGERSRVSTADSATPAPARARQSSGPAAAGDSLTRHLRAALLEASETGRVRALLELSSTFTAEDWPLALQGLAALGISPGGPEQSALLCAWVEVSPEAAMRWPPTAGQLNDNSFLIREWAMRDPAAAMAFARTACDNFSPSGASGLGLVDAVLGEFARADPSRFAERLADIPEEVLGVVLGNAAKELARLPADQLASFVESLQPAVRKKLLPRIAKLADTETRMALAADYPEDVGARALYQSLAVKDPAAAVDSLEKMPPGADRKQAVKSAFEDLWWQQSIPQALDFARRFPEEIDDYEFYNMILNFANLRTDTMPAADLLGEAARIKDPVMRMGAYQATLRKWSGRDPAAAQEWLATHEAPEQIRRQYPSK
jgi:hypothetical protein